MHLDPERSARQTPSAIDLNCAYIDPAGKIAPVIMNFRPLLQIQWPAHPRRAPVERLGGSARRSRVTLPGPDLPCAGSTEPSMGLKVTI